MSGPVVSVTVKEAPASPVPKDRPKDGRSGKRLGFKALGAVESDGEARRLAAAVLEVLAGGRTPTEAAEVLGVSPPRYYALEQRALKGLVSACRKRPRGRVKTSEWEIEKLRGEGRSLAALSPAFSRSFTKVLAIRSTISRARASRSGDTPETRWAISPARPGSEDATPSSCWMSLPRRSKSQT